MQGLLVVGFIVDEILLNLRQDLVAIKIEVAKTA